VYFRRDESFALVGSDSNRSKRRNENSVAATFTTWSRTWRLPMSGTVNSAFELSGTVSEVGKLGLLFSNTDSVPRTAASGTAATFRNRFPAAPSSITLSPTDQAPNFSGNPLPFQIDRDGVDGHVNP
jgi:hypothetical protein